ncbi:2-isopropylmalate synthase [Arcticibacterium luteifluviistationis]|uniref:2-isopropylmalate synthase n=1 Tax=Arcticibacterium luteifluviistationis TaxID=1784714 RepID=A0A2Z4G776_9BACT|nr:2-isopropylmalate synthase [Arcticibacterium luteifluviistationis]AWV97046.1 2-isopropylmalate synthase [Arcticibacterium luteifluviistationis]
MKASNINKYTPFQPIALKDREWPDRKLTHAPIWCSVDLRDGNQSLPVPMNINQKVTLFKALVAIGFKDIEVGFPSASDTEFNFLRTLVEDDLIPDDVRIQVLVQAREPLIRRTFEALDGVKNAIVHLYNSTSRLQRKVTFGNASKEAIKAIAVDGTLLIKSLLDEVPNTNITLQYSPESFSDTEEDYAVEVCEAVIDSWQPTPENKIILNLPSTVEWNMPNTYADQIEWFCRQIKNRDSVIVSLHTHNDRGTGVAATELGLLAGADRVEGTLFGNGERTGNLDLVTLALNMNSHGIQTGLDFSNVDSIRKVYEKNTGMNVHKRHPYAGELVFTAFSGSHQDAIKKGMDLRGEDAINWEVPYLTIDPIDIGRSYEAIIRINSQSGKGGVAYILKREFDYDLPKKMHPEVGMHINGLADKYGRELNFKEIEAEFQKEFVNRKDIIELIKYEIQELTETEVQSIVTLKHNGTEMKLDGRGNGPINSVVYAMQQQGWKDFNVEQYRSHSVGHSSASVSVSYVQLSMKDNPAIKVWGCGEHTSIRRSGVNALISAYNRAQILMKK